MKTVTCKSGIKGWQGRLRSVYADLEEFKCYCEHYGIAQRLGFSSPDIAWKKNPVIQGSVTPSDLSFVSY